MTDAACLVAPLSDAHVAALLEQDKGDEAKASSVVRDSFQNFAAGLGMGTDNVATASSYGFNPITRNRVLLEWIHRGNWLGGLAVEVVAEDMTREGIDYIGEIPPQDQARINQAIAELDIWASLCSGVKWGRLYGGAGCVIMIDGQDPSTPLDVTKVGPGQFGGLLPLDRWTVQPVLSQLIDRPGPDLGLPKFYQITATAGLPTWTIHHSRFIRFIGIELPYYQRVYELLWGLSIFERLFDRLVAFDSATQGAAQLVYKSYLRVLKLKGFREAVSAGGPATQGVLNSLKLNNYYQSIEGMSLIDAEDNLEIHGHQAFGGLAEALVHFGQQLSGALQIPLVRLFGQSPAGLNSTGDSDLKTYYDGIRNQQMRMLKSGALKIYQCCAASLGIQLPADFDLSFKSLWQMTEPEKAQVAAQDSATVVAVWQAGLIKAAVALMELKQLSRLTGRFTNITDEDIAAAARDAPPAAPGGAGRDHLSAAWDVVWKEEEHPRGQHGRFVEKTGAGGGPPPLSAPGPSPAATPTPTPNGGTNIGAPRLILAQAEGESESESKSGRREGLLEELLDPGAPIRAEIYEQLGTSVSRLYPGGARGATVRDPEFEPTQRDIASLRGALAARQAEVADKIANGHAFEKHVIERLEFPGVRTPAELAGIVRSVLSSRGSLVRDLQNGRSAFYDRSTNTLVIVHPTRSDLGTVYRPTDGEAYFNSLN